MATDIIARGMASKSNIDVETHTNNNDIHVTASDKSNWNNKLDKNQGTENSGKVLGTNANGEVIPLNGYGFEYDEETKMLKYGTDPTTNLNQGIGLDDTLSKRGYAADAGAVGELKEDLSDLTDAERISFITDKNISLAYDIGDVVDLTPSSVAQYRYAIVECKYGDMFLLSCSGGISPRAYGFVDSENRLLEVAGTNKTLTNEVLYAPRNAAKIIINDSKTYKQCYKNPVNSRFLEYDSKMSVHGSSWITGRKVSIIGDSISTFDKVGYKIAGYAMYYPKAELGVMSVSDTWWYRVLTGCGADIEINASYAGSRASKFSSSYPDFYERTSLIGNPDSIFVALGVNDAMNSVALGEYEYDEVTPDNTKFRSAYIKGIKALKTLYPKAEIICIGFNQANIAQYNESISVIANHYGCKYVEITDYETPQGNVHPNRNGMVDIAYSFLNYKLKNEIESIESVTDGLQDQIDDIGNISTQSTWTWVMSHISNNGKLTPNNNKNIVFKNPVYATANSTISVDTGYKYQYALYDKDTGAFIERVTWKTDATTLNADYKIRVEISDLSESVLTDYSIAEHLHANIYSSYVPTKTKVIENSANIERIESTVFEFEKEDKNALRQSNNIVNAIGIDSFKEKVLEVAEPTAYKAWSFVGVAGGKLICLYSVGTSHTDTKFSINYKTSENGIIWSSEREIISTDSQRDNVTGKGYDNDGNFIFWVRRGNPGASATKFELYKTVDGNTFEMVSSNLFATATGHIGDIVNVEGHGMFAFWNNYGDTRSWGYVKSTDNGVTWTETAVESNLPVQNCPVEMSPVYLGNGKILVMGRQDATRTLGQFQIQSNDYGETFTKQSTNITDISQSTPSVIYSSENDLVSMYYFARSNGKLMLREMLSSEIWNSPTSWGQAIEVAQVSGRGQDCGNVNACQFNEVQIASFYSGDATNTGIYEVIR